MSTFTDAIGLKMIQIEKKFLRNYFTMGDDDIYKGSAVKDKAIIKAFVKNAKKDDDISEIKTIPRIGDDMVKRLKDSHIKTLGELALVDPRTNPGAVGNGSNHMKAVNKELSKKFP